MELSGRTDELAIVKRRLVVLGDPHGDVRGLERVSEAESGSDVQLVSVGDNVGYADGPTSSRLCAELIARGIPSVYGNHEEWLGEDGGLTIVRPSEIHVRLTEEAAAWCRQLPKRIDVRLRDAPALNVAVVHHIEPSYFDFVPDDLERAIDRHRADVVFVGHTHGPKVYERTAEGEIRNHRLDPRDDTPLLLDLLPGHRYVVDAGSLAKPGHHPDRGERARASYGVLDVKEGKLGVHSLEKDG